MIQQYFLGIETSCDETSLTLMRQKNQAEGFVAYLNSFEVVSSVVSSQIDVHQEFGGVVPEVGARQHAQYIHLLFKLLLTKVNLGVQPTLQSGELLPQNISIEDYSEILQHITTIFVTTTPGLASALKVGKEFAKTVQYYLHKNFGNTVELVNIDHLHGHMMSCFYEGQVLMDNEVFPHLHLLVSGGNTQLILASSPSNWEIIGATLDDAAGESFDKTGRLLGLPYPAGVTISKIAGKEHANIHNLPRGMLKSNDCNFSYSGLKTAVMNYLDKQNFDQEKRLDNTQIELLISTKLQELEDPNLRFIKEMCISIQYVIVEQLIRKLKLAQNKHSEASIGLSGGVSANPLLRQEVSKLSNTVYIPPLYLTGDNAIMITLSGLAMAYQQK
jgi:N6-L-threonylcarbamoyladenine synthase